ncbi:inter-alpha-trypsin inhibitor heavy chain H4 isoform X3 [Leptinotarsa decemlineata]|uniref:inter-alpha-trypsin inhibitor heavy chain H4 isoform X3 n=1 Tax=Leptinotarsa decemlineata TaxID=7539 RepID=UPI003D308904
MIVLKMKLLYFVASLCTIALAAPSDNSFVVASDESAKENEKSTSNVASYPIIYDMNIKSNVSNRFAKTLVTSKVRNEDTKAKEATFTVVLPDKAFISEFVMEIGGKSYKAYVKEKEEAKNIYNQAVSRGQSAGHVQVSARDSNKFTVSINIEPQSKAAFLLTYEELLERKINQYELVLNIHPGQIVKKLSLEVFINESRPLTFVRTPSLRSGNEISKNDGKLNPSSEIQIINSTSAVVKFHPDAEEQRRFAKDMGVKENEGLAGQFVVQYEVERDPSGGEVLLQDGYFVHFFAPEDLEPLPKQVVFVLDTSGSMDGRKIDQLKDAMNSILSEIREGDVINIVEFNSDVFVWNIDTSLSTEVSFSNYQEPFEELSMKTLPAAITANNETLNKAKNVIRKLVSTGVTNIIGGLETALHLVNINKKANDGKKEHQPMIIFLTDGQPNVGIYSTEEITKIVTRLNSQNEKVPIFSLSFGNGADKSFLRSLSSKNSGFSRHIYEASDASLQLQAFYKVISSPLLSNVVFKYDDKVEEVTKTRLPIFFRGSEFVVAGRYNGHHLPIEVTARGWKGPITLTPATSSPVTSLERLWAYLTLKQKLEERETADDKTLLTKKALDLALKYSFVTEVSSLVVVKPNDTSAVDTEDASNIPRPYDDYDSPVLSFSGSSNLYSLRSFSASPQRSFISGRRYYSAPTFGSSGMQLSFIQPPLHPSKLSTTVQPILTTTVPTIEKRLPWLIGILDANKSMNISGGTYELGEHASVAAGLDCPETPLNGTISGQCTLLKDCHEVFTYLTDFQTFEKYFCPLESKYVGVCCPKKSAV